VFFITKFHKDNTIISGRELIVLPGKFGAKLNGKNGFKLFIAVAGHCGYLIRKNIKLLTFCRLDNNIIKYYTYTPGIGTYYLKTFIYRKRNEQNKHR